VPPLQIVNHLIATTNLLGFNSRTAVRKATPGYRFAELNIKELTHTRRTALLYRKDGYLSPAARWFIEVLKSVSGSLEH